MSISFHSSFNQLCTPSLLTPLHFVLLSPPSYTLLCLPASLVLSPVTNCLTLSPLFLLLVSCQSFFDGVSSRPFPPFCFYKNPQKHFRISLSRQLLDKDSTRRLGIPFSPYGEITVHPFFKYIDWNKIERKEVETPYKPRLVSI